jgi:hypothetical protein
MLFIFKQNLSSSQLNSRKNLSPSIITLPKMELAYFETGWKPPDHSNIHWLKGDVDKTRPRTLNQTIIGKKYGGGIPTELLLNTEDAVPLKKWVKTSFVCCRVDTSAYTPAYFRAYTPAFYFAVIKALLISPLGKHGNLVEEKISEVEYIDVVKRPKTNTLSRRLKTSAANSYGTLRFVHDTEAILNTSPLIFNWAALWLKYVPVFKRKENSTHHFICYLQNQKKKFKKIQYAERINTKFSFLYRNHDRYNPVDYGNRWQVMETVLCTAMFDRRYILLGLSSGSTISVYLPFDNG